MRKMMIAVSVLALTGLAACNQPAPEPTPPPAETVEAPTPPPPVTAPISTVKTVSIEKGADATTFKVCATGETSTGGWTNLRLEPVAAATPPKDGIYEFDFLGDQPADMATQVITPAAAQKDWTGAPADVKGVRVKGAAGSVDAKLGKGASACAS